MLYGHRTPRRAASRKNRVHTLLPTCRLIAVGVPQQESRHGGRAKQPAVKGNGQMYVAISEISVTLEGAGPLVTAFRRRLGVVDAWPGFLGLEVLEDRRHPGRYLMISRWESQERFREYMRSEDHRHSHSRIPTGPNAPRAAGFSDYDLVAQ